MAIRYATKAIMLDGKTYNAGDIIPEGLGDRAGAEKWSRLEGQPIPKPATPEIGITTDSIEDVETVEESEEETEDAEESEEESTEEAESTEEQEEAPKRGRRSRNS